MILVSYPCQLTPLGNGQSRGLRAVALYRRRCLGCLTAPTLQGYRYRENTRRLDQHYWPVRERIIFKTSLWERAHEFVSKTFAEQDKKFLAVHWRRGDFVVARRPDVVKNAAEVAPRIKAMMAEYILWRNTTNGGALLSSLSRGFSDGIICDIDMMDPFGAGLGWRRCTWQPGQTHSRLISAPCANSLLCPILQLRGIARAATQPTSAALQLPSRWLTRSSAPLQLRLLEPRPRYSRRQSWKNASYLVILLRVRETSSEMKRLRRVCESMNQRKSANSPIFL